MPGWSVQNGLFWVKDYIWPEAMALVLQSGLAAIEVARLCRQGRGNVGSVPRGKGWFLCQTSVPKGAEESFPNKSKEGKYKIPSIDTFLIRG